MSSFLRQELRTIEFSQFLKRVRKFSLGFLVNATESLGRKGERTALVYLKKQGMVLLTKNLSNRFGEIDLILRDKQRIVFVEVRTRTGNLHGDPIETVSLTKQRKISRAATAFLKSKKWFDFPARFDVVTIIWDKTGQVQELKHFISAFEAVE